jgi:hypothetical protein
MESILTHLRKLILLTENGEEEPLAKLINMSCEVSNQLIRIENGELNNDESDVEEEISDDEDNEETEEIEEE